MGRVKAQPPSWLAKVIANADHHRLMDLAPPFLRRAASERRGATESGSTYRLNWRLLLNRSFADNMDVIVIAPDKPKGTFMSLSVECKGPVGITRRNMLHLGTL